MARPSMKQEIIEAGLQTLHLYGFNGSAVGDITGAAGVPKGSFYNHFESKDALALVALDAYWERGADRIALLADASIDPVERLRHYFAALADFIADKDFRYGCLIGNFSTELAAHHEAVRNRLTSLYETWTRAIEACVQDAIDAKRTPPALSARDIASFLLNSWEGAVLRAKVQQDRGPLDVFASVIFTTLFK
jgi:TetR/AcrR family transcriptional regulator, transcriptional repressor for nem operon